MCFHASLLLALLSSNTSTRGSGLLRSSTYASLLSNSHLIPIAISSQLFCSHGWNIIYMRLVSPHKVLPVSCLFLVSCGHCPQWFPVVPLRKVSFVHICKVSEDVHVDTYLTLSINGTKHKHIFLTSNLHYISNKWNPSVNVHAVPQNNNVNK